VRHNFGSFAIEAIPSFRYSLSSAVKTDRQEGYSYMKTGTKVFPYIGSIQINFVKPIR